MVHAAFWIREPHQWNDKVGPAGNCALPNRVPLSISRSFGIKFGTCYIGMVMRHFQPFQNSQCKSIRISISCDDINQPEEFERTGGDNCILHPITCANLHKMCCFTFGLACAQMWQHAVSLGPLVEYSHCPRIQAIFCLACCGFSSSPSSCQMWHPFFKFHPPDGRWESIYSCHRYGA